MTRYQLFRRRLAPIAFILGLGAIIWGTCEKQQRTHATIVIDVGEAEPRIEAIEGELFVEGEVVGVLHRTALPGGGIGPIRFDVSMPKDEGELRLVVDLRGDDTRTIVRRIHAKEGATITVPIASELR